MKIEVKLSLPVVAPLLDVAKDLVGSLRRSLAVTPALPGLDTEFRDTWTDDLLMGQREDLNTFLGLFNEEFFTEGLVTFDPDNSEAILRACTAIRLRLRERQLTELGDESLEAGEVDVSKLPEPLRRAFLCYLFLATIQELIIQHLEPGAD